MATAPRPEPPGHLSSPLPRRYIVISLSAVSALALVELGVRRLAPDLRAYDVADYQRRTDGLLRDAMPDIVLMGSSRAKYALVPDEFERATGLRAYNFGIAGSKTAEWEVLARLFMHGDDDAPGVWTGPGATRGEHRRRPRPRLIVLGVNASEFRADYVPTPAARYLFEWPDFVDSLRLEGPSAEVAASFVRGRLGPLWQTYHRRYELRMFAEERLAAVLPKHAQHARELRERVAAPEPRKGYDHPWQKGRQLRSLEERLLANPAEVDAASTPSYSSDAAAFLRFNRMLSSMKSNGIAVAVAYLPNAPETERRWAGVEPQMIGAIREICRRNEVPFVDCDLHEVPRTNADYLEEIHVGLPLARRISRLVAGRIVAFGLIGPTEHRFSQSPEEAPGASRSAASPGNSQGVAPRKPEPTTGDTRTALYTDGAKDDIRP